MAERPDREFERGRDSESDLCRAKSGWWILPFAAAGSVGWAVILQNLFF